MGLKPLSGIVLIDPEDRTPGVTSAGLFLKQRFQGAPNIGTVVAIADDVVDVSVGDKVIFNEPSPRGFKYDGMGLLPIDITRIAGIIHP